jgi:hypothetical protein
VGKTATPALAQRAATQACPPSNGKGGTTTFNNGVQV